MQVRLSRAPRHDPRSRCARRRALRRAGRRRRHLRADGRLGRGHARPARRARRAPRFRQRRPPFNHHRTVHGGLRYLQTFDVARLRDRSASAAPGRPHRAAVHRTAGVRHSGETAPAARCRSDAGGLHRATRSLAADRNRGIDSSLHLPAGTVVSADERRASLGPAACCPTAPHRRLARLPDDARRAADVRRRPGRGRGRRRARQLHGRRRAAARRGRHHRRRSFATASTASAGRSTRRESTINATGAAAGRLMAAMGVRPAPPLVKAMNLVTDARRPRWPAARRPRKAVCCSRCPGRGQLSIGTWHGTEPCGADAHW